MYVEDALEIMANNMWDLHLIGRSMHDNTNDWDISFLTNVNEYVKKGNQLSTEQGKIILKLLKKFRHHLIGNNHITSDQIDDMLINPTYKKPLYISADIKREVRYLGGNYIGLRFKFNEIIMRFIRDLNSGALARNSSSSYEQPFFQREYRIWIIPITQTNVTHVENIIYTNRFSMDKDTINYLENFHKNPSVFKDHGNVINCEIYANDLLALWVINVVEGVLV